ncbi:phage holin family protein [Pseudarthrobacter sp. J1738]|uniref:phage holin family protein n=1 Tax=unclassified Pseudarthrobacter TaxID=2647000 RepID=UPI003D26F855
MLSFILKVLINSLALWVASFLLPGLTIASTATANAAANAGAGDNSATVGVVLAYLFIGLIFALVNTLIRPLIKLLALPITVLTLGLFSIIINAGMLYLTAWLSGYTPVHLQIDAFFWTAILASLIISVISLVVGGMTKPLTKRS